MDENKKRAYRFILYWATLYIRTGQNDSFLNVINPIYWLRLKRYLQRTGVIANWLHNLAYYSSFDFEGFDEELFWRDYESFNKRFPKLYLEEFKNVYEQKLQKQPTDELLSDFLKKC